MALADDLIQQIDDELLYFEECSKNKSLYRPFYFKKALRMLNEEFHKMEVNKYYKNKAEMYISVFNDLSNTVAYTLRYRALWFNQDTREVCNENIEQDIYTHKPKFSQFTHKVNDILFSYHCKLEYPEKDFSELVTYCKYDYLKKDCEIVYDRISTDKNYQKNFEEYSVEDYLLSIEDIKQDDKFDDYFKGYATYNFSNRINFEAYIEELKKERKIKAELYASKNLDSKSENNEITLEFKRKSKITKLMKELIPAHIAPVDRKALKFLLEKGKVQKKPIEIKGVFDHFYKKFIPYYDDIPKDFYNSEYDFIRNNFIRNGKDIPISTINSSKNKSSIKVRK